jgi:hypothetical protein
MTSRFELACCISLVLGAAACSRVGASARAFSFVDVADAAGIHGRVVSGDPRRWYIPESNGCGAAWFDYDGDLDLDLFVGNGASMLYHDDGARLEVVHSATSRLYRNDGGMHFRDVTEESGAGSSAWINAVAVGDVDNDGDPDLYLACFGDDVFLRNDGGHFAEATRAAGLANPWWGAGAAFGDADNDGDLDLYVANYCDFDPAHPPAGGARQLVNEIEVGWGPEAENGKGYNRGAPDLFFLGDGKGHFTEATAARGLELETPLCSYGVVFSDVDGDGWQDILVANDLQPCNLFHNRGDGTFVEEGEQRGFALGAGGRPTAAMGLMVEDVDGDGDQDVFRTNFDQEANSLHLNDGEGRFKDMALAAGLAQPSLDRLGWGGAFFDADLDADYDLFVANGHVMAEGEKMGIGMHAWLESSQLYEAVGEGPLGISWRDVTADAGTDVGVLRSARGVAVADADGDGDLDVCVVDIDERPRLLENRSARAGSWLAIRTVGGDCNRDGIGARVELRAGGKTMLREVRLQSGLYSSHSPALTFGLGKARSIESITVRWPCGRVQKIQDPAREQVLVIEEPAGS